MAASVSETTLTFLSTGNPTGLKFAIQHGERRCLFDLGLEHAPGRALFSQGLAPRAGRELEDLVAVGAAPRLEGVYAGGGWDGATAVFISHLHLDHTSLVPYLHPDVPLFFPAGMEAVRAAAVRAGYMGWREPAGTPCEAGRTVAWGDLAVTFLPVDHDVPGASGFLVQAPDLRLAFTGDQRRHGLHPELGAAFCAAVAGVDVLVQEGVTLGFEGGARATERDVIEGFPGVLASHPGLVVVNLTALNRERVEAFARAAQAAGRQFLMEPAAAIIAGREEVLDGDRLEEVARRPGGFVLALGYESLPLLIDLRPPPGSVYVHSNGPPLGAYDPAFRVMEAWAVHFGLELVWLGSTGHSYPEDIVRTVREIGPGVVLPVHSAAPEALQVEGIARLLPEVGRAYAASELKSLNLTRRAIL